MKVYVAGRELSSSQAAVQPTSGLADQSGEDVLQAVGKFCGQKQHSWQVIMVESKANIRNIVCIIFLHLSSFSIDVP